MSNTLEALTDRELVAGLMRGNRAELKLGYSPANAELAVRGLRPNASHEELRGYSQGFSDGMQRSQPMVVPADPPDTENEAYRDGYSDGLQEDERFTYPSAGSL